MDVRRTESVCVGRASIIACAAAADVIYRRTDTTETTKQRAGLVATSDRKTYTDMHYKTQPSTVGASEVTTLWRYTNVYIIIIIIMTTRSTSPTSYVSVPTK